MANKCEICKENITENELGKINGTCIKVKKKDKNELRYVCCDCQQKKSIETLRKELE